MTGMLFTLIAVILAGIGARDQTTIAALTERLGARLGLLFTAILVGIASAAIAAWAAVALMPMLTPRARIVLAAIALALAGLESLAFAPKPKPQEPTQSLGAIAIVLFAHQLTDAARFLVFALANATAAPIAAGVGGATGAAAMATAAWLAPEVFADARLRDVRRVVGGLLLIAAAGLAWHALG